MTLPVLISRCHDDAAPLVEALGRHQIPAIVWPALRFEARPVPSDFLERLKAAVAIAVVSPRAMFFFAQALGGHRPEAPIFAQGAATAAAAPQLNARIADGPYAADLAAAIADQCAPGPVLRICGNRAREAFNTACRSAGFETESIVLYDNVEPTDLGRPEQALRAAIFHSPSAVERQLRANPWLRRVPAIAIGRTTAAALHSSDHPRVIVADSPAIAALTETLEQIR